ncbi:MAG: dihydrofolate synthase / folylpolyglutamate synthase [Variibacter sp.]|jgi:dihydrofolate synthase/folylpolyglutamate synthase|nr:dihydrofolate synthase / folylpolyglutamate synthase [Variibacter sp.]
MIPVDTILARLLTLHPKKIDLSLDRMWRILARLDYPERRLPAVIHVGGTNGKGSTIAFMRAILEAAGKRVHVYTSPHLVRINERFRVAGKLVSDAELAGAFEECERANAGEAITVFEITTAAGLLLFSRHTADVLLMEVGLGGRLDATNVVERPLATSLGPIALDHREFLGDTLALIAREKAGIFKRGVPAVLAPQPDEAMSVLEREAQRAGAPLLIAGEQWSVGEERGRLVYQDEAGLLDLAPPRLPGRHQFENAGLAIATLRAVGGWEIPLQAYEAGLTAADWPARMQRLPPGTLARLAPEGSEIWLDGGHNPHAGRAIAAALADLDDRVPRPVILICGMLANKDIDGFLQHFAGLARRLIAVPIGGQEKALTPAAVAEAARAVGIQADARAGLEDALTRIAQLAIMPAPRILIAGSLYLAGEVLAANDTPPT